MMDPRRRTLVSGALAACVLLSPASVLPAWAKVLSVVIQNVAFGEVPAGAQVGDTIEWTNKDFVAHTATARDGSFDVELPPEKSVHTVLRHAGGIKFYCRYHPTMAGEIIVAP